MPNVMAALPNIGGAFCKSSVIPFLLRRRKVWVTPVDGVPCSNAANRARQLYKNISMLFPVSDVI